jgi:hypothetical protein
MAQPQKPKRGGICIICGKYIFAVVTLEQHYKDKHMEKK